MPAAANHPGVAFRFSTDLRGLRHTGGSGGGARQVVSVRHGLPRPTARPALTMDGLIARFTIAGLEAKRIDEIAMVMLRPSPRPDHRRARRLTERARRKRAGRSAGWSRTTGRVAMAATETLPGSPRLLVRPAGVRRGPARAARLHQVRVRDLRIRFPRRPTSLVVDAGSLDFTLAGILDRRQLAGLRVTAASSSSTPSCATSCRRRARHAARREDVVAGRARRRAARYPASPTSERKFPTSRSSIRTRLTDVPLERRRPRQGAHAAARRAGRRDPRIRRSIRSVRSCTSAASSSTSPSPTWSIRSSARSRCVSPTIYLGEDLIWYMNTARGQAATAPTPTPWTVRPTARRPRAHRHHVQGLDRAVPAARRSARDAQQRHPRRPGDAAPRGRAPGAAAALHVPRLRSGADRASRASCASTIRRGNVVNVLHVGTIRWRDYRCDDGWLSATFDSEASTAGSGAARTTAT